ncbi:MAG: glycosyl transferase family protein, partial [Bacteroidota bacterium]
MADLTLFEFIFFLLIGVYLISGLDDVMFDLVYWTRRLFKRDTFAAIPVSELLAQPEQRAAIFVPAWQEDGVIEDMLRYNTGIIQYRNYDIFVGTYPNDLATQARVDAAAVDLPNVIKVVTPDPGPTTKADNLNAMLATLREREQQLGIRYDFVLLHDAEDILHPFEMKLVNYHLLKGTGDMIQTPILPVPTPLRRLTTGTYMDQFSETQTKDLHVRSWVGGFVPSCGVATTLSWRALDALTVVGQGVPFNPGSMTEDYEMGYKLATAGLKTTFLRQKLIYDVPEAADLEAEEWVQTRSEFPVRFYRAFRQRSRWSLGIVFQSWWHYGWRGNIRQRWLLFHDRKGLWTYPIAFLGMIHLLISLGHMALRKLYFPEWQPILPDHPWIPVVIGFLLLLLANRFFQRAVATTRVYGLKHGLMSVLRQPWDHLINLSSIARAMYQFVTIELRGNQIQWDKTKHVVPEAMKIAMQTMRTSAAPAGVIGVAPDAALTLPVPPQAIPLLAAAAPSVTDIEVPTTETPVLWPMPAVASAASDEETVLWPRPFADQISADEENVLWPPQAAPAGDGASRNVESAKVLWTRQAAESTTPSGDGHARDIEPAQVLWPAPQLADAQHSQET